MGSPGEVRITFASPACRQGYAMRIVQTKKRTSELGRSTRVARDPECAQCCKYKTRQSLMALRFLFRSPLTNAGRLRGRPKKEPCTCVQGFVSVVTTAGLSAEALAKAGFSSLCSNILTKLRFENQKATKSKKQAL